MDTCADASPLPCPLAPGINFPLASSWPSVDQHEKLPGHPTRVCVRGRLPAEPWSPPLAAPRGANVPSVASSEGGAASPMARNLGTRRREWSAIACFTCSTGRPRLRRSSFMWSSQSSATRSFDSSTSNLCTVTMCSRRTWWRGESTECASRISPPSETKLRKGRSRVRHRVISWSTGAIGSVEPTYCFWDRVVASSRCRAYVVSIPSFSTPRETMYPTSPSSACTRKLSRPLK